VSAKSRPGVEIAGVTAFKPGTPSRADYLTIHWLGSSLKINLSCQISPFAGPGEGGPAQSFFFMLIDVAV
jgi:hypothetical protein